MFGLGFSNLTSSRSIAVFCLCNVNDVENLDTSRASDFFQDLWAEVTHGAKNGGSLAQAYQTNHSRHLGGIIYLYTDTDTCMHICIMTADYTVKPVLSCHSKKKTNYCLMQVKSIAECSKGSTL